MTTFAELEALVVAQTRRPEVTAITQSAIRTAVLRAHHTDFFPRDLASANLAYTPASSAVFYDFPNVRATLLRLRGIALLQSLQASNSVPVEEFEYRELSDLYDADGTLRPHIYTMLGDTLRVYPMLHTGLLGVYHYRNPVVTSVGFSSWIADDHPDEVAMWAAGIVYARTGFMELAKDTQDKHVQPFKELLISSYLLGNVS